jgi:hypothetical protein
MLGGRGSKVEVVFHLSRVATDPKYISDRDYS